MSRLQASRHVAARVLAPSEEALDTPLGPPRSLAVPGVCYSALRHLPRRDLHPLETNSVKPMLTHPLRHDARLRPLYPWHRRASPEVRRAHSSPHARPHDHHGGRSKAPADWTNGLRHADAAHRGVPWRVCGPHLMTMATTVLRLIPHAGNVVGKGISPHRSRHPPSGDDQLDDLRAVPDSLPLRHHRGSSPAADNVRARPTGGRRVQRPAQSWPGATDGGRAKPVR